MQYFLKPGKVNLYCNYVNVTWFNYILYKCFIGNLYLPSSLSLKFIKGIAMKIITLFTGVLGLVFLSGCSQTINPVHKTELSSERIYEKNYTVGKQKEVFVGEAFIKVKDYKVKHFSATSVRADVDFTMSGGPVAFGVSKSENYKVIGSTLLNDQSFRVVQIKNTSFGILIDQQGHVYNRVLNSVVGGAPGAIELIYDFDISPMDVTFLESKSEEIDVNNGFQNFELIYSGTNGSQFNVTYREFSPGNMAKTAFYQDIVYGNKTGQIRFKNFVVQVHEVTNEKFIYTVVKDELKNQTF